MPAAVWTRTARDLIYDPAEWSGYLTIQQIQHATGLAEATIRDSMARPEIANPTVPRGALCRPAARIGAIPMWSQDQLDEYHRRVAAAEGAASPLAGLPKLTMDQARERGLVTIEDLAGELNCALNPLRRLGRDQNMPAPVALARRHPDEPHGRQHELRDRAETLRWLNDYSQGEGARDRIAVPQHLLDEIDRDTPALSA